MVQSVSLNTARSHPELLFVMDRDAASGPRGVWRRRDDGYELIEATSGWQADRSCFWIPVVGYPAGQRAFTVLQDSVDKLSRYSRRTNEFQSSASRHVTRLAGARCLAAVLTVLC